MPSPEEFGLPPDAFGDTDDGESGPLMFTPPTASYPVARRPAAPQARPVAPVRQPTALDEIEDKLALATYYRAVLSQPLFDDPSDPYAHRVQGEVSAFITTRMAELVGAGKPKPQETLTDAEVKVLKYIAQNLGGSEVQALKHLAQRVLSAPPASAPAPARAYAPPPPPAAAPAEADDEPPAEDKPRAPRIRARKAPAAPEVQKAEAPSPAARRARKAQAPALGRDPLQGAPTQPVTHAPAGEGAPQPIPMPRGPAMEHAMTQKAYEALNKPSLKEPGTP
jgi:hypothetical protein